MPASSPSGSPTRSMTITSCRLPPCTPISTMTAAWRSPSCAARPDKVQHFAEHVIAERGVRHGRVVLVPTDLLIKPHSHERRARARHHPHPHPRANAAPHRRLKRPRLAPRALAIRPFGTRISANDHTWYDVLYPANIIRRRRDLQAAAGVQQEAHVPVLQSFNDDAANVRGKIIAIYTLLIAANLAVWAWAFIAFHDHPVLLGTCFLAYSFGLRHAVDADHIAAIDNVTRKLMQEGKRPLARRPVLLARPFDRGGSGLDRRRARPRWPSRTRSRSSIRSAA